MNLTLKGEVRVFEDGMNALDIAGALSQELKKTALAARLDGKVISLDEVMALAELPSKDVLLAQTLGMMLAPITSFAIVIKAIAEKMEGGASDEETPAEA